MPVGQNDRGRGLGIRVSGTATAGERPPEGRAPAEGCPYQSNGATRADAGLALRHQRTTPVLGIDAGKSVERARMPGGQNGGEWGIGKGHGRRPEGGRIPSAGGKAGGSPSPWLPEEGVGGGLGLARPREGRGGRGVRRPARGSPRKGVQGAQEGHGNEGGATSTDAVRALKHTTIFSRLNAVTWCNEHRCRSGIETWAYRACMPISPWCNEHRCRSGIETPPAPSPCGPSRPVQRAPMPFGH